jgi:hypothetical protein
MTALKEYMRLETTGLWRATPDAQRREVGVAFGDATLVISDLAGRPMTHWSLPAIVCLNPGQRPAVYAPDTDASESLEIEDDLMIGAISRVQNSLARRTPRPGRVRQYGITATVVVLLAAAVIWLPGALTRQTLSGVPPSKRSEIGATLLGHLQRQTGATCRDPLGTQALGALKTRLFGAESAGQIVVLPGEMRATLDLPGGILVLGQAMVEDAAEPAVVAGHVLAALAARDNPDPLSPVLEVGGFASTIRLLTTGDLPTEALDDYADYLMVAPPKSPDAAVLGDLFAQMGIVSAPWAAAVDPEATGIAPLLAGGPPIVASPEPILTDAQWVALQGICQD